MIKDYDFFLSALFCVLWIITRVSRQVKVGSGSLGFINPDQTIPEPVSPSLSYWCSYETAGDWERGGGGHARTRHSAWLIGPGRAFVASLNPFL